MVTETPSRLSGRGMLRALEMPGESLTPERKIDANEPATRPGSKLAA
jgi:hypothetical protein